MALCGVLSWAMPLQAAEYTIGIAPQQAASELAKRWGPIIKYWSDATDLSFQFRTAKDIDTFQVDVREGRYNIMFVNAHHYTEFNRAPGYEAFAREIGCSNAGVIVVSKGSPAQNVQQLDGAMIAFSSPSAVIGTWLPVQHLKQQGVNFTPNYVKSMDSVYRSVAKGLFPAGGGEQRTLGSLDQGVKNQLRVIWKNDFPCHPFSAHPLVPRDVVQKLQKAMKDMHQYPQGAALLQAVNIKGFEPTNDAQYDTVRKMHLKPL